MPDHDSTDESEWRIVEACDGQPWPCTIVDRAGRSILAAHDGTPVIRDRTLAERIVAALNDPSVTAPARHDCSACEACIHDGNRCCGCYDGACCQGSLGSPGGDES